MPGDMLGPSEGGLADWALCATVSGGRGGRRETYLVVAGHGGESEGRRPFRVEHKATRSGAYREAPDVIARASTK